MTHDMQELHEQGLNSEAQADEKIDRIVSAVTPIIKTVIVTIAILIMSQLL